MKFYFSSYKIGDEPQKLQDLLPENPKGVYISNAVDFAKPEKVEYLKKDDLEQLAGIGVDVDLLDLREYFGKKGELKKVLEDVDLIYSSGGNVFDLRLAMKLSGFDEILQELQDSDKVYAGYSAAVCVLSPTLRGYHIVDDPNKKTYGAYDTMWKGLGIVDWMFAPHFDSEHAESEDINKEIAYYKEHNMKYKPLRDGEVIIQ